jgi:hypothetical protein
MSFIGLAIVMESLGSFDPRLLGLVALYGIVLLHCLVSERSSPKLDQRY